MDLASTFLLFAVAASASFSLLAAARRHMRDRRGSRRAVHPRD